MPKLLSTKEGKDKGMWRNRRQPERQQFVVGHGSASEARFNAFYSETIAKDKQEKQRYAFMDEQEQKWPDNPLIPIVRRVIKEGLLYNSLK